MITFKRNNNIIINIEKKDVNVDDVIKEVVEKATEEKPKSKKRRTKKDV